MGHKICYILNFPNHFIGSIGVVSCFIGNVNEPLIQWYLEVGDPLLRANKIKTYKSGVCDPKLKIGLRPTR